MNDEIQLRLPTTPRQDRSGLLAAAASGDLKAVRAILQADPTACNNVIDETGRTALHKAARHGQADMVDLLLKHGADANILSARKHRSPLYDACSKGFGMVACVLINAGADINAREMRGRTPLYAASFHDHADLASQLLQKGADCSVCDNGRRAPHFAAAAAGHAATLQRLLSHPCYPPERWAALANAADAAGRTALHYASMEGHADTVDLLLSYGAGATHQATIPSAGYNTALTPLHAACFKGHLPVVAMLLDRADVDANLLDRNLCSPLHMACRGGHREVVALLLERGAQPVRNGRGRPPLLDAAISGNSELLCDLLDGSPSAAAEGPPAVAAADTFCTPPKLTDRRRAVATDSTIDVCDNEGRSALHMACYNGHERMVRALLQRGCPASLQDADGQTALHMAALGGRAALVPLLAAAGCDGGLRDSNGLTAAQVAATEELKHVIEKEDRWRRRRVAVWVASGFAIPAPGARPNVLYRLPTDVSRLIISAFL